VGAARAIYSCGDDSASNLAVVLATAELSGRDGPPLRIYAQMFDPYLSAALRARMLVRTGPAAVRVDFFHTDELAARAFFRTERLRFHGDRAPRIVVVDMTAFGHAIVVAAARQWRNLGGTVPLDIDVVDRRAAAAVLEMTTRFPFIGEVCHFRVVECVTVAEYAMRAAGAGWPPDMIFLCGENEDNTLRTALTEARLWHNGPHELIVRLDSVARLGDAARRHSEYASLLDPAGGRLSVVGVVETGCDPDLIDEDLIETLARAVHDRYVAGQRRLGRTARTNPSVTDWDRLPATKRVANRAQVRHVSAKLTQIGCVLMPRTQPDLFQLNDYEVEALAIAEHERWWAERLSTGWTWGPDRDDDARLHPDLVPWSDLTSSAQDKDRSAVRDLPSILSDAGFEIVRLREAGAAVRSQRPAEGGRSAGPAAPGSGRPGRGPRWPC
jgi:hypothetical protein